MVQDFPNGIGLGDKSYDTKSAAAITLERVGKEDPPDKLCPSFSKGGTLL